LVRRRRREQHDGPETRQRIDQRSGKRRIQMLCNFEAAYEVEPTLQTYRLREITRFELLLGNLKQLSVNIFAVDANNVLDSVMRERG